MATRIMSLVPPTTTNDVRTDIRNALLAQDKLVVLLTNLAAARADAARAFLRTVATDVAALKDDPGKAFADSEFAKYTTWRTADDDFVKRIEAFKSIEQRLDDYVEEFAAENRDELLAELEAERDELEGQLEQEEADEDSLQKRIRRLKAEIARWSSAAARKKARKAPPAAAKKKKSSARRP
jgi:uncharacterized protein YqeY